MIDWYMAKLDKENFEKKANAEKIFGDIIKNQEINEVSIKLFTDGYYRNAVLDAMVQLEMIVKRQAKRPTDDQGRELSGCSLMRKRK